MRRIKQETRSVVPILGRTVKDDVVHERSKKAGAHRIKYVMLPSMERRRLTAAGSGMHGRELRLVKSA